jgi:hypothetical protein
MQWPRHQRRRTATNPSGGCRATWSGSGRDPAACRSSVRMAHRSPARMRRWGAGCGYGHRHARSAAISAPRTAALRGLAGKRTADGYRLRPNSIPPVVKRSLFPNVREDRDHFTPALGFVPKHAINKARTPIDHLRDLDESRVANCRDQVEIQRLLWWAFPIGQG